MYVALIRLPISKNKDYLFILHNINKVENDYSPETINFKDKSIFTIVPMHVFYFNFKKRQHIVTNNKVN